MKLTESERETLAYGDSIGPFQYVDDFGIVDTDNHGVNWHLCVFFHAAGDASGYYGFLWGSSSEEHFFDETPVHPVKIEQKTIDVAVRCDGKEWDDE